ncbi:hypothetical protein THER_0295 [Thermodesulfovibrio sp. N1]|nr:hypothetical protein THER_0295 [Thermodesulfovibrio sp. N1]
MSSSEAKRLKVLEDENLRLKRLLAEKELEIQVLRDIVKKLLTLQGNHLKLLIEESLSFVYL